MRDRELGTTYGDGEAIIREGEAGDCMYVVQAGTVEVLKVVESGERRLALLSAGEFFGEMAVFEAAVRTASVRAVGGDARVLRVDKRTLLRRIQEDPLLAVNLLETLSRRLREADARLAAAGETA